MKRKLLTIAICLSVAVYVIASDRGLDVIPTGRQLFEIAPEQIVTTAFHVTNSTYKKRLFISEVKLPEHWRLITEDFPFELEPGENITKLVSFFVPEKTPAGRYRIRYLVRARKSPLICDFCTIDVIVLPPIKEKREPPQTLPHVIAGAEYCLRDGVFIS